MKWFLILFVAVLVITIIVKAVSNGVDSAAEKAKNAKDRANGAYEVSKNENLADRFKK